MKPAHWPGPMVNASFNTEFGSPNPGTGAGGESVVVIATLAPVAFQVTKPTPSPSGSRPVGNWPSLKSSMMCDLPVEVVSSSSTMVSVALLRAPSVALTGSDRLSSATRSPSSTELSMVCTSKVSTVLPGAKTSWPLVAS